MEDEPLKVIIGRRLSALREERGITQQEFADRLDISKGSVSNYEGGLREPSAELLIRISDLYRVTLDYLVGRSEDDSTDAYLGKGKVITDNTTPNVLLPESMIVRKAYLNGKDGKTVPVINEARADMNASILFAAMKMLENGTISKETFDELLKKIY